MISIGDIFTTYKLRSETWIARNFPEFHSFIFSVIEDDLPWREKLYLHSRNLTSAPRCRCGAHVQFINITKGYRRYCSNNCKSSDSEVIQKRRQTNIDRWGGDNPMKSDLIKRRQRQTLIERWGVENISKLPQIKEKVRQTNRQKFGVDYISQKSSNRLSLSQKMKVNYDRVYCQNKKSQLQRLENKLSSHNIKLVEIVKTSMYRLLCGSGHAFEISKNMLNDRIRLSVQICTLCNPINSGSDAQRELYNFILDLYNGEVIYNWRGLDYLELDIYLPELKIAFEYNGLYWHSNCYKNKNYHQQKKDKSLQRGIWLFHIWEDDWLYKKVEMKKYIKSVILGEVERALDISMQLNINKFDNKTDKEYRVSLTLEKNEISHAILVIDNGCCILKSTSNDIHLVRLVDEIRFKLDVNKIIYKNPDQFASYFLVRYCGFNSISLSEPIFHLISGSKRLVNMFFLYCSRDNILLRNKIVGIFTLPINQLSKSYH